MGWRGRVFVAVGALIATVSCAHERHADIPAGERLARPSPRGPSLPASTASSPAPGCGRLALSTWVDGYETWEPYETWLGKLRDCTSDEAARAKDHLTDRPAKLVESKEVVAVRGRLAPGMAECTLMGCRPGPCCNGCSFDWVVVPRENRTGRMLRIRRADDRLPLRGAGVDCAVSACGAGAAEIIVAGRIADGGALVVDADLCRVRSDQPESR
jgi:hypothetical protein